MGAELTLKQQRFVKEYLIDQNASRAARDAGYSETSAREVGCENLTKPAIKAAIDKGLKEQAKQFEAKAIRDGFTKEVWLKELQQIATANMDDFVTIKGEEVGNGKKGKKVTIKLIDAVLSKDRPRWMGGLIKKISTTANGGISIELYNKLQAIETLGKHYRWLTNEMNFVPPSGGISVSLTMPANGSEALPPVKKDEEE